VTSISKHTESNIWTAVTADSALTVTEAVTVGQKKKYQHLKQYQQYKNVVALIAVVLKPIHVPSIKWSTN
jgi:hypothetical protein